MSEALNLRKIFIDKIRDKLFSNLYNGPLKGWNPKPVYDIVDYYLNEKNYDINYYIANNNITLFNMIEHVNNVVNNILIPWINTQKVT